VTIEEIRSRAKASQTLPEPQTCRALRRAAGVTVREMARTVGVSRQAVEFWESGKRRPSGPNLERYVEALHACRGAG